MKNELAEVNRIEYGENEEPMVNGRELYEFLEIETPYKKWFDRMIEYGFTENVDFIVFGQKCPEPHINQGRTPTNHWLTLDMAKELCMIQRTERGKQARLYFIEVEKEFRSPEKLMARALKVAEETLKNVQVKVRIQEQQI